VSPIRDAFCTVVGASKIARDMTTRRRLESLLSSIVTTSDDAIVSKTPDGIVTSWNPAAERMFGYTAAEIIGKSIRTIIPAGRQVEEDFVLDRIRNGQKVEHFETVRQAKDGHPVNISLTVSPIKTAGQLDAVGLRGDANAALGASGFIDPQILSGELPLSPPVVHGRSNRWTTTRRMRIEEKSWSEGSCFANHPRNAKARAPVTRLRKAGQ
jgi:PAS domain S-box-containing protein